MIVDIALPKKLSNGTVDDLLKKLIEAYYIAYSLNMKNELPGWISANLERTAVELANINAEKK